MAQPEVDTRSGSCQHVGISDIGNDSLAIPTLTKELGPSVAPTKEVTKKKTKKKKIAKPGIMYLSRIPTNMNVKIIRSIFEIYGEIGRIFLQPEKRRKSGKKKVFTEGWVEFTDKKIAKNVAHVLNNTQIGGKKRNKSYEELWNIKYLHQFKWGHLNEKLAYERAVHQQRMRTEISQVKKETNFYIQNVEKKKVIQKIEKRKGKAVHKREFEFRQKQTDQEISAQKKQKTSAEPESKQHFLKNLFSGGVNSDDNSE